MHFGPGFFYFIFVIEYYNEAKYFYIHPHYGCKIEISPI
jgi:hypothetical protein